MESHWNEAKLLHALHGQALSIGDLQSSWKSIGNQCSEPFCQWGNPKVPNIDYLQVVFNSRFQPSSSSWMETTHTHTVDAKWKNNKTPIDISMAFH
jgi:hypothetical protein